MAFAASRFYPKPLTGVPWRISKAFAPMITAALAINIGSVSVFTWDWNRARISLENYVGEGRLDAPIRSVTLSEATAELGAKAADAITRTGYPWSWAYRSVVLAKNYRPLRIIYDPEQVACESDLVTANSGSVPLETRIEITTLMCTPPPPHLPTLRERLMLYFNTKQAAD
jgi:hypothetical protein